MNRCQRPDQHNEKSNSVRVRTVLENLKNLINHRVCSSFADAH